MLIFDTIQNMVHSPAEFIILPQECMRDIIIIQPGVSLALGGPVFMLL